MLDCLLSCLGGQVNHEIDIEIPANCVDTDNVCDTDVPHVPGAKSCIGDFSTSNFNNYLYTQNSGSGPAYANMCVKVKQPDGKTPLQLVRALARFSRSQPSRQLQSRGSAEDSYFRKPSPSGAVSQSAARCGRRGDGVHNSC